MELQVPREGGRYFHGVEQGQGCGGTRPSILLEGVVRENLCGRRGHPGGVPTKESPFSSGWELRKQSVQRTVLRGDPEPSRARVRMRPGFALLQLMTRVRVGSQVGRFHFDIGVRFPGQNHSRMAELPEEGESMLFVGGCKLDREWEKGQPRQECLQNPFSSRQF